MQLEDAGLHHSQQEPSLASTVDQLLSKMLLHSQCHPANSLKRSLLLFQCYSPSLLLTKVSLHVLGDWAEYIGT